MNHPSEWVKTKILIGALLVVTVALWAFEGTTANTFVWDSIHYLFEHENRISHISIENIFWMITSLEASNWHPLTWLSWAIDYQVYGGLESWGYHFSNNILHSLNSVLVFILMLVVFSLNNPDLKSYSISKDNYSLIAALLTALVFAVHPQHVESVAWIAERKDLLCQFFMLLSLLAYVKYVTCQKNVKTLWFLGTLGLFSLAVLSKPMAVTFPVILLLIDVYPLRRTALVEPIISSIQTQSPRHLLLEKIPFILLSAFLVLITMQAQNDALKIVPFDLKMLNALNSIILYLEKLVIPLHFSPHYPYFLSPGGYITPSGNIVWGAFAPLAGFVGISFLTVMAWLKDHRAWMIAWLFYLIALSPVLGLIQVGTQGAADRYAYFPTLSVYLLMGSGILAAMNHSAIRRFSVLVIMSCLVTLLAFSVRQQVHIWQNELTLWDQAVNSYPRSVYVRNNLAIAHLNQGNYEIAAYHFDESERLWPISSSFLIWRGFTYMKVGRYKDALKDHINFSQVSEVVLDLKINQFCIQYNTGWLYAQMGMFEKAIEFINKVDPNSISAPDAGIWLKWLVNIDHTNDNKQVNEKLPGFCENLTPSESESTSVGKHSMST